MSNNKENNPKQPFQWSRFLGYTLFIFGILCAGDLLTPARFPAAGLLGGISIIAGFVLIIPNKMSIVRKIAGQWKNTSKKQELKDPLLPVRILKLAKAHRGVLTLSIVAIELNVPLSDAEAGLDECVRQGLATPDYDMGKEVKYYRFQEDIPPESIGE